MEQKSEATVSATSSTDLIEELLEEPVQPARLDGVVIGRLIDLSPDGPYVDFPGNPAATALAARTTAALSPEHRGREIALMFERGEPSRPIIIGLLQRPETQEISLGSSSLRAELDGERLVISAEQEIVLRCGRSSITLTRAGKILIRGDYLLSRSSGVNRIRGGSVELN